MYLHKYLYMDLGSILRNKTQSLVPKLIIESIHRSLFYHNQGNQGGWGAVRGTSGRGAHKWETAEKSQANPRARVAVGQAGPSWVTWRTLPWFPPVRFSRPGRLAFLSC